MRKHIRELLKRLHEAEELVNQDVRYNGTVLADYMALARRNVQAGVDWMNSPEGREAANA